MNFGTWLKAYGQFWQFENNFEASNFDFRQNDKEVNKRLVATFLLLITQPRKCCRNNNNWSCSVVWSEVGIFWSKVGWIKIPGCQKSSRSAAGKLIVSCTGTIPVAVVVVDPWHFWQFSHIVLSLDKCHLTRHLTHRNQFSLLLLLQSLLHIVFWFVWTMAANKIWFSRLKLGWHVIDRHEAWGFGQVDQMDPVIFDIMQFSKPIFDHNQNCIKIIKCQPQIAHRQSWEVELLPRCLRGRKTCCSSNKSGWQTDGRS